jgi:hypothetical protein
MKVLVTQDFLATRSTASKSRLSILEPAGPRLPPSQPCLEVLADEIVAQNFFCFKYFHGLSAASPLGWALRMTSGKVSKVLLDLIKIWVEEKKGRRIKIKKGDVELEIAGGMSAAEIQKILDLFEEKFGKSRIIQP